MRPVESALVSYLSFGEGWHNYHHAFPWDYRAAEFGTRYSFTTFLINLLAKTGQAYDLKTASTNMITKRVKRTGDGTHPHHEEILSQDYEDKPEEETKIEDIKYENNDVLHLNELIKRPIAVQG